MDYEAISVFAPMAAALVSGALSFAVARSLRSDLLTDVKIYEKMMAIGPNEDEEVSLALLRASIDERLDRLAYPYARWLPVGLVASMAIAIVVGIALFQHGAGLVLSTATGALLPMAYSATVLRLAATRVRRAWRTGTREGRGRS